MTRAMSRFALCVALCACLTHAFELNKNNVEDFYSTQDDLIRYLETFAKRQHKTKNYFVLVCTENIH